jgi:acetyltransferase
VVLHPADMDDADLPQLAIRPYPVQYADTWESEQDIDFVMRPIRPEDEPAMVRFHETLSERTVQLRYFTPMNLRQRTSHERLSRICFIDYAREMALVAVRQNPKSGEDDIAAVGRLTKSLNGLNGEFGIIVSDRWQGQGLGKELLRRLIQIGRDENLVSITGYVLPDNQGMLNLTDQLGFTKEQTEDGVLAVTLQL